MTYVSILLVCMALSYCYVMFRFWRGFETSIDDSNTTTEHSKPYPQVSVIVPFRNEAQNILPCLASILNIDYPNELLELILVNDGSTDHSVQIVKTVIEEQYEGDINIKLLHSIDAGKKSAIIAGIRDANHAIIVCTDADCVVPKSWIKSMTSCFTGQINMVTGPVLYNESDSLLKNFQALDLLGLVAVGAGSLRAGMASMCNGANLAYKKHVFERLGGFSGNDHLSSGDDLFLMHKFHEDNPNSIFYSSDKMSAVRTKAMPTLATFLLQRKRWASKARHYQDKKMKALSLLVFAVNLGILFLGISSIFLGANFLPFLFSLGIKAFADFLILRSATKQYDQSHLMRFFPISQVLHIPYVVWTALTSQFGTVIWKDRAVNS